MEHKQIKKRIQRMTSGQPVYPALLKEIRDYPKELYYIGDPKLLEEKCVSIVGSRKTNQYGRSTAYSFGKALGQRGITVVSGMAVGIDTCAHEGALQEKGHTAAVLACGLDLCYPPRNRELKGKIESAGIVLSEYRGLRRSGIIFPRETGSSADFPRLRSWCRQETVVVR